MRIQKVENVNKCLEFIRQRGVNLTNIGAEGNMPWLYYYLQYIARLSLDYRVTNDHIHLIEL